MHAHHRAVARIDPLDFAGDKAVRDIVATQPAVFLGDSRAQEAHLAHFLEYIGINTLFAVGGDDARLQHLLGKGAGAVGDHALFFGELIVEAEGICPVEGVEIRGILGAQRRGIGVHGGLLWRIL